MYIMILLQTQYQLVLLVSMIVVNFLLAIPIINSLYKLGFYKTKKTDGVDITQRNPLRYQHMVKTMGRPSSFGIMLIPNILITLVLFKVVNSVDRHTVYLIIVFAAFLLLGLVDDIIKYHYYLKTGFWGLQAWQKLLLQLLVCTVFFFFTGTTTFTLLTVAILFSTFMANAYNITDGLDGFVGSLTVLILPTLLYLEKTSFNNPQIITLYIILLAFFIVFLYFNIKPARVTLGDVGALPIGLFLGILGLRYGLIVPGVLFAIIILEGLSSFIQILSIRLFKRKVFLIAPFHYHLLNKGWDDTKIVQRAWLIQFILCITSVLIFSLWK